MINISMVPEQSHRPHISVIGVGGAGGNAVANMIQANLIGVNFVIANTDVQALDLNPAEKKIKLGTNITEGLGAGANPEIGAAAAEESFEEIQETLRGSHMVFITAGMGGGTGSGAAPVVARAAKELGILTVAVVTKPFSFEGARRMNIATAAVEELQQYVDTVIMIPNQNLFRIATERTTLQEAFKMADDVLYKGVRGVTDLMVVPGFINLDFNDIKTVMSEMGQAMMGAGEAEGERRAIMAAEMAISSPLLDGISMQGARGVLINITGGDDMTLYEVDEAANRIREEVDPDANIIFGTAFDSNLDGRIRVSVVATGLGGIVSKKTGFQDRSLSSNSFSRTTMAAKKPEPQKATVHAPIAEDTPAEVTASAESFLSSSSSSATSKAKMDELNKARKEKEDTSADFDDLEIPAFLRRQAN